MFHVKMGNNSLKNSDKKYAMLYKNEVMLSQFYDGQTDDKVQYEHNINYVV